MVWVDLALLGPLGLVHGLLVPVYFLAQPGNGGDRARGRRRTEAPPVSTVDAHRSSAGIKLQSTISKSEGLGRERVLAGFRSGDSRHGRGAGRWSAPSSHSYGHGSTWGEGGFHRPITKTCRSASFWNIPSARRLRLNRQILTLYMF